MPSLNYPIIGFLVVTAIGCCLVLYDKIASKWFPRHRIRERTLFWVAAIGGAFGMYLTMLGIRHKTRHKAFMIGLPCMFCLQLLIALCLVYR